MKKSFYSVAILFTILLLFSTVRAESSQPRILLVKDAHWDPSRTSDNWGLTNVAPYYINALNALGLSYDNCTVNEPDDDGPGYDIPGCVKTENRMLKDYDIVIWFTGNDGRGTTEEETLTADDRNATEYFLDNGGRLFLTGQDIGFECYNLWSPKCNNNPFYGDYLHAYWCKDNAKDNTTIGAANDPIGNSLLPDIGGGAENQNYPSVIFPVFYYSSFYNLYIPLVPKTDTASSKGSSFYYNTFSGSVKCDDERSVSGLGGSDNIYPAVVRSHTKGPLGNKVVYFAFGFEGIANEDDRIKIMNRTFGYLSAPATLGAKIYANASLIEGVDYKDSNITCDPTDDFCHRDLPKVNATCKDFQLFANVSGAEYYIDNPVIPERFAGNGTELLPLDGSFNDDDVDEVVYGNISLEGIQLPRTTGTHTIYVHCNDTDGYWGKYDSYGFFIDRYYPLDVTLTLEGGKRFANKTKPTMEISYSDIDNYPHFMRFSCNGTTWTSWIPFKSPYSDFDITNTEVGCPSGDGNRTVYVQIRDEAGNWNGAESTATYWIILDRVAPRILSITPTNNSWLKTTDNITIVFYDPAASDGTYSNVHVNLTSNGTTTQLIYNDTEFNPGWVNEGSNILDVWINDTAGNLNYTRYIFGVDNSPPTIAIDNPLAGKTYSGVIDLLTTIEDVGSGVDKAWYQVLNASNLSQVFASDSLPSPDFDTTWNSTANINENETVVFNISANDTLGWTTYNVNVTFIVDNRKPKVRIYYPREDYLNKDFYLNLNISSPQAPSVNISYTYYNITNETWFKTNNSQPGKNYTSYAFTELINLTALGIADGNYTIYLWANNTNGLSADDISWFYVDRVPPEVWDNRTNLDFDVNFGDRRIYPGNQVIFEVNVSEEVTQVDTVLVTLDERGTLKNYTLTPITPDYKNDTWRFSFTPSLLGSYEFKKLYANDTVGNFINESVGIKFLVVNASLRVELNDTNEINAGRSGILNLTFELNKTFDSPKILIYIPTNYVNSTPYTCYFGINGCNLLYSDNLLNISGIGNNTTFYINATIKALTPSKDSIDEWKIEFVSMNFTNTTKIKTPFLNITRVFCDGETSCIVYQNKAFNLTVEVQDANNTEHTGDAYDVYASYGSDIGSNASLVTPVLASRNSKNITWNLNITKAGSYTFTFKSWEFTKRYNATPREVLIQVKDTVPPTIISSEWGEDNIFNQNETIAYYVTARDNVAIDKVWMVINQSTGNIENHTLTLYQGSASYGKWKSTYANTSWTGNYSVLGIYANDTEGKIGDLIPSGDLSWFEIRELIINTSVKVQTPSIGKTQTILANVTGNASTIENIVATVAKPRDYNENVSLRLTKTIVGTYPIYTFEGNYTNVTRSGNYSINTTVTPSSGVNKTALTNFSVPFGNVTILVDRDTLYLPIDKIYNLTFYIVPENGDLVGVNGSLFIDNETVINLTSVLPQNQSLGDSGNIYWELWRSYPAKWEINISNLGSTNVTLHINSTTPSIPIERQNATKVINVTVIPEDKEAPRIIDFGHERNKINLFEENRIWINATDNTVIDKVLVEINYTTGTKENLTASRIAPNYYELDFTNANVSGNYSYRVIATDIAGNENSSSFKHFFAYDNYSVEVSPEFGIYNKREKVLMKVKVRNVNGEEVSGYNLTLTLDKNGTSVTLTDNLIATEGNYTITPEDPPDTDTPATYWIYAEVNKSNNHGSAKSSFLVSKVLQTSFVSPTEGEFIPVGTPINISVRITNQRDEVIRGAAAVAFCGFDGTCEIPTSGLKDEGTGTYTAFGIMRAPNVEKFTLSGEVVSGGNRDPEGPYPFVSLTTKKVEVTPSPAPGTSPPGALPTCDCSEWKEVGCGAGNCSKLEMYMLRTCNPAGCAPEQQCVESPICKGENFLFNLTDSVEVEEGEGKKIIGSLSNIGNLPLTITLSLEKECCEISIVPSSFDLPVNSEKTVTIPIHVPLNTSAGEYLMKITAKSKNLVKVKSVKILVKKNPKIVSLQNLEKELNELEKVILEYKKASINVQELEDVVNKARTALQTGKNAIGEDKLQTLTNSVNELQDNINYIRTRLLALKLLKFLNENKWNIIGGIIAVIILSYVTTEIVIPFFRIRSEIKKLEFEENSIIKSRKETEKHYFLRKIDESTFRRVIAEKQSELYKVIATIKLKKEERSKLVRAKLNPLSFFKWCKEKLTKHKKK